MKKKTDGNALDLIPFHKEGLKWEKDENERIIIFVENKGLFYWITQKCMKKPRFTQVHLDAIGSFIWPLIDGKNSVYDIAMKLKEQYGEKAEPLYERIVKYMTILSSNDFIKYN